MDKVLSVITVTFNSGKTLQRTIDSIRNQADSRIEYIIIDGKSQDETLTIIKKNLDVVTNWISEKDKGIYDAMNKGIQISTGKYIAFMNSDDWYEKDVLGKVLPILEKSEAEVVYGDTNIWSGETHIGRRIADEIQTGKIPLRMPFSHQSCFVLSSVMRELGGFSPEYKLVADFKMIISIIKNPKANIERLPFAVSGFSVGGASSNIMMSAKERLSIHLMHGLNPLIAFSLYGKWISIGLVKSVVSPEVEIILRKFKTKFRL